MSDEFPFLEEIPAQRKFLDDWVTPRKLLKSKRGRGKSTMMLCEANRFFRNDFKVVHLSPTEEAVERNKKFYYQLFNEKPLFEMFSYSQLLRGEIRGRHAAVVVADEFQELEFDDFTQEVLPMDPLFVRASVSKPEFSSLDHLSKEDIDGFFGSVYEL